MTRKTKTIATLEKRNVTQATVESASAALREEMGQPKRKTQLEAIHEMKPLIEGARTNGYSWDEIAQLLKSQGIHITARILENAIAHLNSPSKKQDNSPKENKDEEDSERVS